MSVEEYEQLKSRLAAYLEAEQKILSGAQEYTVGEGGGARRVRRGELEDIRKEIARINQRKSELEAMGFGAVRARRRVIYPNY